MKSYSKEKKTWRIFTYIALFIISFILSMMHSVTGVVLSVEADTADGEKTVRVGYYTTPGFQEYNSLTGEYGGYSYEYLIALKQYTNWKYEFVPVEFSEGVTMLEQGKIDLMNNVSITKEREESLNFSDYASGTNYACLITRSDNTEYAYNDFTSFGKLHVGLLNESIFNEKFMELCEEKEITPTITYYDTSNQVNDALSNGEIDARVVSSSYTMDGRRILAKFSPMDYYIAVPKKETKLWEELNEAMVCIREEQPGLEKNLEQKYYTKKEEELVVLTEEEKQYMADHRSLRWHVPQVGIQSLILTK